MQLYYCVHNLFGVCDYPCVIAVKAALKRIMILKVQYLNMQRKQDFILPIFRTANKLYLHIFCVY